MELVRNLTRRRLRSSLTVSGITIGVLALTTMGALAEKANNLLDGGVRFFSDHIAVVDASSTFGSGLISTDKVAAVEAVPGVAAAFPSITLPARLETGGFGAPDLINATLPEEASHLRFKLAVARGRPLVPGARGEVVLGSDLARKLGVQPGSAVTLPIPPRQPQAGFVGRRFTVVGVLARTLTAPDSFAQVGFADAQAILRDSLPPALRGSLGSERLATGIDVFGTSGTNLDALAREIQSRVPGVRARPPGELVAQFQQVGAVFSALTTGSALLALVVGGLSVVNTMVMAVSERVHEIGLKKAVGARTGQVLREYLLEAMLLGLLGGLLGLALGALITSAVNAYTEQRNLSLFLLTPRLALLALLFAVGLGTAAGMLPAVRAARLDPVAALRSN